MTSEKNDTKAKSPSLMTDPKSFPSHSTPAESEEDAFYQALYQQYVAKRLNANKSNPPIYDEREYRYLHKEHRRYMAELQKTGVLNPFSDDLEEFKAFILTTFKNIFISIKGVDKDVKKILMKKKQ